MESGSSKPKVITVLVLLIVAIGYSTYRVRAMNPPGINNGVTGDLSGPQAAARPDMHKVVQDGIKYAGITPDQFKQLMDLRDKGDMSTMREEAEKILTPDQQQKVREFIMQQTSARDQKVKAILSPQEFKRYQEKRAERFGRRGSGPGRTPARPG